MSPIERAQPNRYVVEELTPPPNRAFQRSGKGSVKALLIEPTNNTFLQFARYTIVGAVALGADFCALFLLTYFGGLHYLVSAALAFLIGLLINYGLSAAWVFARRSFQNRTVEFAIFAGVGIVGLGLNELGMWTLTSLVGLHYLWAKLFTAAFVYIWNFSARKVTLFR
jgi:putative flippase GtrA